jgi:hypothetical protein
VGNTTEVYSSYLAQRSAAGTFEVYASVSSNGTLSIALK